MVLPPCHYGFQVYTRELSLNDRILEFAKRDLDPSEFRRGGNYGTVIPEEKTLEVLNKHNIPTRAISLMWNQRSVDTFLGLPFNIASYGLLLEIIAKEVNMTLYRDWETDRKSTRLNSSHSRASRMPSSA